MGIFRDMEEKQIKIYTTSTCPFCAMAKEYLSGKGVDYEEKDVAEDLDARQEMLDLSGQSGVPVIAVDGQVVVGFNQEGLEALLAEK